MALILRKDKDFISLGMDAKPKSKNCKTVVTRFKSYSLATDDLSCVTQYTHFVHLQLIHMQQEGNKNSEVRIHICISSF